MKHSKLLDMATAGLLRTTVNISDGSEVKIRAFAVKELKLLMMASESGSAQDYQVIQILNQCIETDGIDANDLPSHDVEYLYLQLYKISKGTHLIPVKYLCTNEVDGKKCNNPIATSLNLNNVVVDESPIPTIKLTNGLVFNMRLPTILEMDHFSDKTTNPVYLAIRCIKSVDTGSEVLVVGEDLDDEELAEVVDYLDESAFNQLIEFVTTLPSISLTFPLKCQKCGHEEIVTVRGLSDFFG
jgi:hypothetical protein